MNSKLRLNILVILIVLFSVIATFKGIFSSDGPGTYEYKSIRGQIVQIYGKGLYKDMSAEVAPQGIAQDVITLTIGIPLLLIGLYFTNKNKLKGRLLLAGTLFYFFISYLFFMLMEMYNVFTPIYMLLTSLTFFSFTFTLLSLNKVNENNFNLAKLPNKFTGWFLIINSLLIGTLWLKVVIPPMLNNSIPVEVEHYTTLVVQGMDLSLLLPLSFLIGYMYIKRSKMSYYLAPVYIIFLSILMIALIAKIVGMSILGVNAGPALVIIPIITLIAIAASALIIMNVKENYEVPL